MLSSHTWLLAGLAAGSRNAADCATEILVGTIWPVAASTFWPSGDARYSISFQARSGFLALPDRHTPSDRKILPACARRGSGPTSQSKSVSVRQSGVADRL